MKIALIGPGIMPIPPNGWGAVETLIWEYYIELKKSHDVTIINTPNRNLIIQQTKGFDFIHIHYDCFYDIIPFLDCKHIAITSHYPYIDFPEKHARDGYTKIFNFILRNDKFWIFALCEKDRNVFIKHGANPDKIFVTKNGVSDRFKFKEIPTLETICLGKIEQRKRQHLLKDIPAIDFVGPFGGNYRNLNLNSYKGSMTREELYEQLTNYTNLILISEGESDPLVVKEALMAGLGVVVSESSSHMIDTTQPFIDVIPEKEVKNTEYIKQVIEKNKEVSKHIREQIRNYASKFLWTSVVSDYIKKVEKIVNE